MDYLNISSSVLSWSLCGNAQASTKTVLNRSPVSRVLLVPIHPPTAPSNVYLVLLGISVIHLGRPLAPRVQLVYPYLSWDYSVVVVVVLYEVRWHIFVTFLLSCFAY